MILEDAPAPLARARYASVLIGRPVRSAFIAAAALSAALLIATCAMWAVSYRGDVSLRRSDDTGRWTFLIDRGLFQVMRHKGDTEDRGWALNDRRWRGAWGSAGMQLMRDIGVSDLPPSFDRFGVATWRYQEGTCLGRTVVLPLSGLALAAAVLPGAWIWVRLRRVRRPRAGLCRWCGYDLRATPNRCPECGMAAAPRGNSRGSG